jgi:U4/U6.U5 tri-snRNP-associated protein 1
MATVDLDAFNKIRRALGAKELHDNQDGPVFKDKKDEGDEEVASTLETREAAAGDNWKRLQEQKDKEAQREKRKELLRKQRAKAELDSKLLGKTLGEADEAEELSTKEWLKKHGKRVKNIEKKRELQFQKDLEERDALLAADYSSRDLAGVRVDAALDDFANDDTLVLKDKAVDAESDDELEGLETREALKLQDKLDKKRKRGHLDYNANDAWSGAAGANILSKYDDEEQMRKKRNFTLDGQGTSEEAQRKLVHEAQPSKGVTISLESLFKDEPIQDYQEEKEIKVKKPKKSKSKKKRERAIEDDDILLPAATPTTENGDVDMETNDTKPKVRKDLDDKLIDDDDLQKLLARQRMQKLKQNRKNNVDFAQQLREEASATPDVMDTVEDHEPAEQEEEEAIIIDDTAMFLANLRRPESEEAPQRKKRSVEPRATSEKAAETPDADGDIHMNEGDAVQEGDRARSRSRARSSAPADVTANGLEEEATFNTGVGALLKTLRERGALDKNSDADAKVRSYVNSESFKQKKRQLEEEWEANARQEREKLRQSGKLANMSNRERELYAQRRNAERDQYVSQKMAQLYQKEYRPNPTLTYKDAHGRTLTEKEAFKELSHMFHGKGSGNKKTEKHLRKIEDEKRREAMSTLDSSQHAGISNSMSSAAKKNRKAGVRLQ